MGKCAILFFFKHRSSFFDGDKLETHFSRILGEIRLHAS